MRRIDHLRIASVRVVCVTLRACVALSFRQRVVRADADTSVAPASSAARRLRSDCPVLLPRQRCVFVRDVFLLVICATATANEATHEIALTKIVGVDDSTASQLDPLSAVVDPCEVDVQCGLNDAKDDAGRIEETFVDATPDPVEDVEEAVATERDEVVAIDDGRNGGLTEEEKLWQDADALEDDTEGPDNLAFAT